MTLLFVRFGIDGSSLSNSCASLLLCFYVSAIRNKHISLHRCCWRLNLYDYQSYPYHPPHIKVPLFSFPRKHISPLITHNPNPLLLKLSRIMSTPKHPNPNPIPRLRQKIRSERTTPRILSVLRTRSTLQGWCMMRHHQDRPLFLGSLPRSLDLTLQPGQVGLVSFIMLFHRPLFDLLEIGDFGMDYICGFLGDLGPECAT